MSKDRRPAAPDVWVEGPVQDCKVLGDSIFLSGPGTVPQDVLTVSCDVPSSLCPLLMKLNAIFPLKANG